MKVLDRLLKDVEAMMVSDKEYRELLNVNLNEKGVFIVLGKPIVSKRVAEWIDGAVQYNFSDFELIRQAIEDCDLVVVNMAKERALSLIMAYRNGYEIDEVNECEVIELYEARKEG